MSWREVLDSEKRQWGHIDRFVREAVAPSGYLFFAWNGRVYMYHDGDGSYRDTGITVDNLK